MDLVILNHGQVTRTTPELASSFRTSTHTNGKTLNSTDLTRISLLYTVGLRWRHDPPRLRDYEHWLPWPPYLSYHTLPTEGLQPSTDLTYTSPSTRRAFSGSRARTLDTPGTCP
ncbi:hypothetical protein TNCV_4859291 [Trichonephila clavipes]|nr:hypothetical protein TNCV_4859291 [Trichonephila clavipes]